MYKLYRDSSIDYASYFNFDIYADSLSKIILNSENKTPFTVAINGKWGSGKTTLMKTLEKKLKKDSGINSNRKVKTVWFDAWKYPECDSMFAALICEILKEIEREGYLSKLKTQSLLGLRRLNVLKIMSDTAKMLSAGKLEPEFEQWVEKETYKEKLSFYDLFQDYMKEILQTFVTEEKDKKYGDNQGILVIFIDDLDRCPHNNIADVLESINLFLDQEGCFFIIGTDIPIIANAIKAKYKDIEGFSGIEYIKKMIQLKFDLPLLQDNDIKSFMKYELKIDSELDTYLDIIIKGLRKNQREIIRFINTVNFMRILGTSLKRKFVYDEELLIKWNVLDFSSPTFIDEIKRKNNVLFEIQSIARMKDEEREDWIHSLKEEDKQKYNSYCQNKKIIDVLSSGKEQFNQNNIGTYLFLSNIVPKEIKLNSFELKKDLAGKDLRDVDLWGTDLREVNFMQTKLQNADLRGTNLVGVNFTQANLQDADLQGANLAGANFQDADLQGANLEEANLAGANLQGANLLETNLKDAYLSWADFRETSNLLVDQLCQAKKLEATKLDDDLLTQVQNICPKLRLISMDITLEIQKD